MRLADKLVLFVLGIAFLIVVVLGTPTWVREKIVKMSANMADKVAHAMDTVTSK